MADFWSVTYGLARRQVSDVKITVGGATKTRHHAGSSMPGTARSAARLFMSIIWLSKAGMPSPAFYRASEWSCRASYADTTSPAFALWPRRWGATTATCMRMFKF
jgi:hypothetical protein